MPSSSASSPPSLLIIGTGGTIAGVAASAGSTAGYQAGALPIGQILDSVPGLSGLVPEGRLATEQVFSIPSEQMSGAHWLQLAGRLRAWLGGDKAPDAIVITHGTDTLELRWPGRSSIPGLSVGQRLEVEGTVGRVGERLVIINPLYRVIAGEG